MIVIPFIELSSNHPMPLYSTKTQKGYSSGGLTRVTAIYQGLIFVGNWPISVPQLLLLGVLQEDPSCLHRTTTMLGPSWCSLYSGFFNYFTVARHNLVHHTDRFSAIESLSNDRHDQSLVILHDFYTWRVYSGKHSHVKDIVHNVAKMASLQTCQTLDTLVV